MRVGFTLLYFSLSKSTKNRTTKPTIFAKNLEDNATKIFFWYFASQEQTLCGVLGPDSGLLRRRWWRW